mmetsp:Transcript_45934/g.117458  ORF Transcript_45934/g.117458 Transcript_45934/m.117458 type:complete len:491 (+) Transcript_45934:94-1566(+)
MELGEAVPSPNAVTVCEINCRLVNADSELLASPSRNAAAGTPVYPEIVLSSGGHTNFLADYAPVITIPLAQRTGGSRTQNTPALERIHSTTAPLPGTTAMQRLQQIPLLKALRSPLQTLFPRLYASCLDHAWRGDTPPPFALHPRRQVLMAADRADRIHVYNVEPAAPALGSARPGMPATLLPELLLYHEFQQQVGALAWRPPCGSMLAAGCSHGICLWNLGGGPSGASISSQRGKANAAAWMTFLRSTGSAPITALAWSPCGQFLASGSVGSTGIDVWHVALGSRAHLQSAFGGTHLLRWSPCGSYLLSGGLDERFLLWETQQWRSQSWQCSGSGRLIEAAWKPDGRAVALAFSRSSQIVMLHLTQKAPKLSAQMLPMDLPELRMCDNPEAVEIRCMQWDPAGVRLAIVVEGDHPGAGLVALYATSRDPIVSSHFLGFIRPPFLEPPAPLQADNRGLGLTFQGGFKQGALLAIRRGEGQICMVPMYFSK